MKTAKWQHGFGFLFEMGCGKTLTAIAAMGTAYQMKAIDRVLVIAPATVVPVWPKELEEYADFPYTCETMQGDKRSRLKALKNLEKYRYPKLKVAVINYESTWREGIFEALQEYDADLIICDESQRIKTHDAEQSAAVHKLGDRARYKMILSGTPVQNQAIDIWSQYRFLDRTVYGDSFWAFRGRYARMGGFNNKQIIGYNDLEGLTKKEHSIAFRVTKDEALDLPEQTFITQNVEMPEKERRLYDQVRRDGYAELSNTEQITATTILVKLLRMQQITGGFLVSDDSENPQLVSRAKLDALKDIIIDYTVEGGKKLVIFARFIAEVKEILALAEKTLPKDKKAVCIFGEVKKEDRGDIVEQFQRDPDTMIFIGQIDTAGTGITLTAADTCVYYSKTYNYATYEQSLSRIHRIGQRNCCTYLDLVVPDTIDEMISRSLKKKEDLAKTVVDNWKTYFN